MTSKSQEVQYRGVAQWLRRKPHLISRGIVARLAECDELELASEELKAKANTLEIPNSERTDGELLSEVVMDLEAAIKSALIIKETGCEIGSTILIGRVQAEVTKITPEFKVVAQVIVEPWRDGGIQISAAPLQSVD